MKMMKRVSGKIAFGGIAIGTIQELSKKNDLVRRVHVEDVAAEQERFKSAQKEAIQQLQGLYDKAVKEVGEDNAAIFEVHQMMLEDLD